MADFATWAAAVEPALGVSGASFLDAYEANRESSNESAIQSSLIAEPLMVLMSDRLEWTGSASDLLEQIKNRVDEATTKQKGWPKLPHVFSGQLRRIAPNLRKMNLDVDQDNGRDSVTRRKLISIKNLGKQRSERSERSEPTKDGFW